MNGLPGLARRMVTSAPVRCAAGLQMSSFAAAAWRPQLLGVSQVCRSQQYFGLSSLAVPAPPKRPINAYLRYSQDRRPKLKHSNPEMKPTMVVKMLSQEWMNMPAQSKESWETAAKHAKEAFVKEKAKYESQFGKIVPKKKEKRATKKSKATDAERKAKRPPTAFNLFFKEQLPIARQELGKDAKVTEATKVVAKKWNALADGGKEKYTAMAAAAKAMAVPPNFAAATTPASAPAVPAAAKPAAPPRPMTPPPLR